MWIVRIDELVLVWRPGVMNACTCSVVKEARSRGKESVGDLIILGV